MKTFEPLFESYMNSICQENPDPSHDLLHVKRVVALAKKIGTTEKADLNIVIPAAYLHDCVYISKTDERRSKASAISADRAIYLLNDWGYPTRLLSPIHHAISAHSFSANIPAETIEAKIIQDADRLDAMGAIGIFRCFALSGLLRRPFYLEDDPFCINRQPDDQTNTLDHFYKKLLHLHSKLNTNSAKLEGTKRLTAMNSFLNDLKSELL